MAGSITFHVFLKQQIYAGCEKKISKIKTATVICHHRLSISLPWMDFTVNQGMQHKGFDLLKDSMSPVKL